MIEFLEKWWRPAVEIILMAVGIYYGLTFVRGTRGASIVTGLVVVLLGLMLVINYLELPVLRWLLSTLSGFFSLAVIILFQPELRRILARVGNLPLFNAAHEQRENIELVIQTVERLSEVRIGALIAIQQAHDLREWVESGIPVDCAATPEMLEAIFFPNNAIHDGGVILKGDRIAYAACIFPLSRRQDLSRSIGTRHRAALGLSEETDAVVVVVSEETGRISYAYQGRLVRGVSLEELRSFLTAVLVKQERGRPVIRRWLQRRLAPAVAKPAPVAPKPPPPKTIVEPDPAVAALAAKPGAQN